MHLRLYSAKLFLFLEDLVVQSEEQLDALVRGGVLAVHSNPIKKA